MKINIVRILDGENVKKLVELDKKHISVILDIEQAKRIGI